MSHNSYVVKFSKLKLGWAWWVKKTPFSKFCTRPPKSQNFAPSLHSRFGVWNEVFLQSKVLWCISDGSLSALKRCSTNFFKSEVLWWQCSNNPSIHTIDSPISAVRCKKKDLPPDVSAESRFWFLFVYICIYTIYVAFFLTVAIASRGDLDL